MHARLPFQAMGHLRLWPRDRQRLQEDRLSDIATRELAFRERRFEVHDGLHNGSPWRSCSKSNNFIRTGNIRLSGCYMNGGQHMPAQFKNYAPLTIGLQVTESDLLEPSRIPIIGR